MNTLEQQYRKALIFLIVVILAGSGYWILKHFRPELFLGKPDLVVDSEAHPPAPGEPAKSPSVFQKLIPASEIVVHVAGAVQSPGVYRLSSGARVQDAIANRISTNPSSLTDRTTCQPYLPHPRCRPASVSSKQVHADEKLPHRFNTATSKQLQALPRIGPVMAQRIIDYRETNDGFSTVDDLINVKGIGEKTLEKIWHLVVVY